MLNKFTELSKIVVTRYQSVIMDDLEIQRIKDRQARFAEFERLHPKNEFYEAGIFNIDPLSTIIFYLILGVFLVTPDKKQLMLDFVESVKLAVTKWSGRFNRREFIISMSGTFIVYTIVKFFLSELGMRSSSLWNVFFVMVWACCFAVMCGASIRRLHDLDLSEWYVLVLVVIVFSTIQWVLAPILLLIPLVYLMAKDGGDESRNCCESVISSDEYSDISRISDAECGGESKIVAPNMVLASVESRFISRIIDACIVLVMGVIIDVVLGGILYRDELNIMHVLFAGVYYIYFFGQGQTLGMKAVNIKLCRTDGTYPIGYAKGVLRWIGTYVSLFAIGLGYLWILIDENRQGWHDKIADTYVVQE